MKTLKDYIKESIFDIEDNVEKFDNKVLNNQLNLDGWRVANDNKTIISTKLSAPLLYGVKDEIMKFIKDNGLKFQPIRLYHTEYKVNYWDLPCDYVTKYEIDIHENARVELDFSKFKPTIEATIAVSNPLEVNIDSDIIGYRNYLDGALFRGEWDMTLFKDWECKELMICCRPDTTGITWDDYYGHNEEKIKTLISNNPKTKSFYLIDQTTNVSYKVKMKGTGKNRVPISLIPMNTRTIITKFDKTSGIYKYMTFKSDYPELFEK